jgi:amino acid adenylation domain-containing protein
MIETLIDKLVDLNVRVELVEGDKLKVHAGISKIPGELLEELKQHKEGLIKYLKEQQNESGFEAIQLTEAAESYQPTPAQKSIWLISQFEEANIAYNMPGAFVFEGELDYDSLSYAFGKIIERYEVLRTVFRENKTGEVRMYINQPGDTGFLIRQRDYRTAADTEQLIRHTVKEEFTRPFDLANGPLVRADLCHTEDNTWVFILVMHHIISDGWSMDLLLNELLSLYNARATGEDLQLNPLRIQYKDIAAWQNKQLEGGAIEEHRKYWLKQFDGTLPVLELPADKERPNVKTYNGNKWSKELNNELSDALKKLAYENDATLFMSLLALVNALFHRCTKQEDIIIGTPVAGREHADTLDQVGYFINTLALRTLFNGTDSFKELLSKVKQVVLDAFKYQAYPFDELVTGLNLQRDISRNPLFDAQVVLQNSAMTRKGKEHYFHKLKVSEYEEIVYSTSVFFTVFSFTETTDGLRVDMMYNSDIYSEKWMQRLGNLLESLLVSITRSPGTPINRLSLLDEPHLHAVLYDFNNTATAFNRGNTVTAIFREQAKRTPGAVAVVNGSVTLTYKELDEQSDLLASILLSKYTIQPGQCIGVMLERSDKIIIAILGILKAGAVYVPVDPEYPLARKEYIIKDTGLQLLVTQTEFLFDLENYRGVQFAIDIQLADVNSPLQNSLYDVSPEQTAYIIYTSGSTGEPKGVVIPHSALTNSILAQQEVMALTQEDRSLQFFPVSFDVSIFEIFIALMSGAELHIISDYEKKDPAQLAAFIREHEITVATLPAVYLQFTGLENTPTLKKLVTGGEQADSNKVYAFSERGTYYNAYGPTESAICVTLFMIEKGTEEYLHTIPVGKPLANIQLYITDEFMAPVPIGITGEIYIGGAGLAKEYLNNPQMTTEKFVKNPFKEGDRLYKTGDLGRWKADGNIEFIGRKDDQVKIRGHRIELGEIQTALQGYKDVKACVVTAIPGHNGESELVAYITADEHCSAAALRTYLSNIIPVYMLPAAFIQLEELPLTANGKVDKSKLPAPSEAALLADTIYAAPRNETEEKIAAIWKEMLGREKVGITDDYFEIGGNSLKAMSIIKRMIDETGISVPLKILFEEKTIENILKGTTGNSGGNQPAFIPAAEAGGELLPLAWNQQLYFSPLKPVHETVQALYEVEQLDMNIFRLAIQELVNRHEILRTIYIEHKGVV